MLLLVLASGPAAAHILMDGPPPVTTLLKDGPCGDGPHVRGSDPVVYEPGETITVEWHETVDHTSTFRISFDDDGDDSFADPQDTTDFYTNGTVLLDQIPDEPDQVYAVEVTLPDVTCETCTLQLMQWMQDKPPYVPGTNDIYYQCADLALRAPVEPLDTGTPAVDDDAVVGGDGGGGCGQAGGAGYGLATAALVTVLARRRAVTRPARPPAPCGPLAPTPPRRGTSAVRP